MKHSNSSNKLIGALGIVFGLLCLGSFLAGDNTKLIIPSTHIFLVKYFVVISMINGGLYFIVAGVLIYRGIFVPAYAKTNTEHKQTKAKGILLSLFLLSPFLLALFTVIFTIAKSVLWKILGSLALIYIIWLLYSNVRTLRIHGRD